jgi:hypothetical protein
MENLQIPSRCRLNATGDVSLSRVGRPPSPVEDQLADARQVAVALNELLKKKLGA